MRLFVCAVALVVAGTACSAGKAASKASSSTSSSTTAGAQRPAAPCRLADTHIEPHSTAIPVPKGNQLFSFTLTNLGGQPCSFQGYPTLGFLDSGGHPLQVPSVNHGGGALSSPPAQRVDVPPNDNAYFVIDKQDCQHGNAATMASVSVRVPGDPDQAVLPVSEPMFACQPGDPGNTVEVSPILANARDALVQ